MEIAILTLFPDLFEPFFKTGLNGKALNAGLYRYVLVNPRDFTHDVHRSVDDTPYGGGRGMVIKPEPIVEAYESLPQPLRGAAPIILTPRGKLLTQETLIELSLQESLVFICGRYKGVDSRVSKILNAREISIGDYVIQGGETAAMVVLEGILRLIPGFLGDFDSAATDSFIEDELISAPEYTRPAEYRGLRVPDVLLSGNHADIQKWRTEKSIELTRKRQEELLNGQDNRD